VSIEAGTVERNGRQLDRLALMGKHGKITM